LSNQIDLQSTLVRAEALFNRFQRTVESVDRKNHFPIPSNVRQRRPGLGSPQPSQDSTSASTSGAASRATPALLGKTTQKIDPTAAESSTSPIAAGDTRPVSSGKGKRRSSEVAAEDASKSDEKKVISQELRDLLKRDIYYKLDKGEVKKHGGGVGS
jgi:hypothetical protein